MSEELLSIHGLHVSVDGKPILKGVDLVLRAGEVHALMGKNGSGKSTLAQTLLGHPRYQVTAGKILFLGEDITAMATDVRARKGLFLAFQYPSSVPGVSVGNFLRASMKAVRGAELPIKEFRALITEKMKGLQMDSAFLGRYLNDGFSGGEKKRNEVLQMALLAPKVAVLDETDSGLDIDALRIVAEGIQKLSSPGNAMLLITHYQRILNYVQPGIVHVMVDGRIARTGGPELAKTLEEKGYDWVVQESLAKA